MSCFRGSNFVKDLGFSISPLTFCLIGSLIRQSSPIGDIMDIFGFRLISSQLKNLWKIGSVPTSQKFQEMCQDYVSLTLFGSTVHPWSKQHGHEWNQCHLNCTYWEWGRTGSPDTNLHKQRKMAKTWITKNCYGPLSRIICFNTVIQIEHPILGCLWIPLRLSRDLNLGREDNQA